MTDENPISLEYSLTFFCRLSINKIQTSYYASHKKKFDGKQENDKKTKPEKEDPLSLPTKEINGHL